MSRKTLIVLTAIALLAVPGIAPQAAAQTESAPIKHWNEPALTPPRRVRQRIEINPQPLRYRHCVDWYELQNRPSGTVLYPQMRCWWVRG